ncbi:hypothetical protein [Bradyrhizobium sp. LHD-71]|uniref:hypothetical protein n=1 Tax=Bradyrhizobium sp. LHD-71 TaxID=3072141 RepID=UPI00280EC46F|nr:hypothetical protein [Bradyrhizobium sp. LHD-71]MDQ8729433.1 hypothetical protein [Bradyrhizobium sp. LHD-71]
MSYYTRNHLQDDWTAHAAADAQRRVRAAEQDAGWYFDQATRRQKAEFDATMHALLGVTGPRANRARDAARTQWQRTTAEAQTLFERTVDSLLATGEVTAELDEAWTALADRDATLPVLAAAS